MKSNTPEQLKQIIIERSYPEPNTGCWLWGYSVNAFGYGILKARQLSPKIVTAHRASYWLFKEPFDLKMQVLHKCDTPACVNPEHLFIGTHQDNMTDRKVKGRTKNPVFYGSDCKHSKLREYDILDIRASGANQYELAKKYSVSQSNIAAIKSRKSWKHI